VARALGSVVDERLVGLMSMLAQQAIDVAPDLTLLFVTNIRDGDVIDIGPDGVSNMSQYYTRNQADAIIRSFQDLGVTVESFFSEREFIARVIERSSTSRPEIVYTTAEGGTGSGRRALIPSLCNLLNLPVLNSGAHACSLARHKLHANAVLRRFGVRVPETWQFGGGCWVGGRKPAAGARVIAKPAFESMCIGIDHESIQVVDRRFDDFVRERSESFSQPVVVQEFISGAEVGVSLIRVNTTYALQALEVRRGDGESFGDLAQTFKDHMHRNFVYVRYETDPERYATIQRGAIVAFDVLGMSGVGRVDFRVDDDGQAWAFDTNESPPPLAGTAYATAMEQLGFPLKKMLAVWLGIGLMEAGLISGV
jgi:D-alanine-D-alanine ligase